MSKKLLVSDLSLEYKGKKGLSTLKNITFDLNVEEIGCILGPSGCGKTSLLRAIAGLEDISEGRIIVDGRCISTPTSRVPSNERSIGMVFQDYALFPNLNVEKNIAFSFNNKNQPESQKKIKELLDLIGLSGQNKKFPHELSGGEQQRVALARAIANEPNILLLDEPFSSIDTEIKENLIRDIKNLLDHLSITTLMVTHDQYEAFSLADTIAVMNEGKFHQIGSPYDIYHEPLDRFVADFIGMGTFLPATVNSHGVETPLGTFPIFKKDIINLNKNQLEIFVRPDDVVHNDQSNLKAIVKEKHFRGADFLYHLMFKDQYELLCYAPSHHNHAIGESIGIEVHMKHAVLFEKELI